MDSALGRLSVHPKRLVGWKSIGQFLSCTERTARRWEVYRALPVYRVPGGTRSSVWAHADELAARLRALPTETRAEMPGLPAAAAAPTSARISSLRAVKSTITFARRRRLA